jgi:hypothetical protein
MAVNRRRFLTPDLDKLQAPLDTYVLYGSKELFYLVDGALSELTDINNWEVFGTATPEETTQYFLRSQVDRLYVDGVLGAGMEFVTFGVEQTQQVNYGAGDGIKLSGYHGNVGWIEDHYGLAHKIRVPSDGIYSFQFVSEAQDVSGSCFGIEILLNNAGGQQKRETITPRALGTTSLFFVSWYGALVAGEALVMWCIPLSTQSGYVNLLAGNTYSNGILQRIGDV